MEGRMNSLERFRKPNGVRSRAGFREDFVRAEVVLGEFLRRPSGTQMFRRNVDGIADVELKVQQTLLVSGFFIPILGKCNLLPEVLVKGFEIDSVVLGIDISNIAFGMDGNCRVTTLVCEERGYAGGSVRHIVECEFGEW
jgi:hypothetical protein